MMKVSKDVFAQRGRALENAFFRRVDQGLIQKLREKAETERGRELLAQVTGISDPDLLSELLEVGIGPDTVVCLTIVPLVQVAWADRVLEPGERQAVLKAAEDVGIVQESASYQLLSSWLQHPLEEELFTTWQHYVTALADTLEPASFAQLKTDVTSRARQVAKSAGGVLGLGSISEAEETTLREIGKAFG